MQTLIGAGGRSTTYHKTMVNLHMSKKKYKFYSLDRLFFKERPCKLKPVGLLEIATMDMHGF